MTQVAIHTEGLGRRFGNRWAVSGLTMELPVGSTMVLLGPNGAGKSTTMMMLLGLLEPSAGSASVAGLDVRNRGREIRARVGYVPERPALIGWMSVEEIMGFVGSFYPTWDGMYADRLRHQFALDPAAKVRNLSRGETAKLSLLLALAHHPEVMLLDDALSAVDTLDRREIISGIIGHMHEEGISIFMATHQIGEIEGLVERVGFMDAGSLTVCDGIDALKAKWRRIRRAVEDSATEPDLPPGVNIVVETREGRQRESIIDNYSERDWSSLQVSGILEVEELSLEEIYVAVRQQRSQAHEKTA